MPASEEAAAAANPTMRKDCIVWPVAVVVRDVRSGDVLTKHVLCLRLMFKIPVTPGLPQLLL
jgi:hypothetical protein